MLVRTHVALGLLAALILIEKVTYHWLFLAVVLVASMLPDVDSMYSFLGQYRILRPLQWAVKHRGVLHSLTFCSLIAVLFAFFIPRLAFPFFLGYGLHLLADSFTVEGIRPFWPLQATTEGSITTGGTVESSLFYGIVLADVLLVIRLFV